MWETWNDVFRATLGPAERGFVGELRGHRNRWAHQAPFSRRPRRAGDRRSRRTPAPDLAGAASWSRRAPRELVGWIVGSVARSSSASVGYPAGMAFDTHAAVKTLTDAGADEALAVAVVEVAREVHFDTALAQLESRLA